MKMWKRLICWAVCLMMVCALAVSVAPVEAEAATSNKVVVCAALDSNKDVAGASAGVPIVTENGILVYTEQGFYTGSGNLYAIAAESGTVEMTYVSSGSGFDVFKFNGAASDGYKAAQAEVGADVTLHGIHENGQVTGSGSITGYDSTPTSDGYYKLKTKLNSDTKFYAPVAVLNSAGKLVAVTSREGTFAFAEPAGGAAPKETKPAPKETQPAPQETQPAPKETQPAPQETQPAPQETQPAPQETQPAPTEAAPAPDGPARETEATEPVPGPAPKPGMNTGLIIGIAAAAVVIVVIVLLVVKKKKKVVPVVVDLPETMPVKPVPKPEPNNWETVPAPSGIRVYIVGADGALRGQEYQISERGITIGRAEDANVRYPADTKGVSRRHCKIFWNNGVLMVMDLGSTSGTFLRGKGQLPPNAPVAIVEGDVIYLGSKQNAMVIRTK